ncbi:hypothetical protein DF41_07425 [Raoultella planticola]|nr:hypothetical protein DF41_07425 [Raoultella planticola]
MKSIWCGDILFLNAIVDIYLLINERVFFCYLFIDGGKGINIYFILTGILVCWFITLHSMSILWFLGWFFELIEWRTVY